MEYKKFKMCSTIIKSEIVLSFIQVKIVMKLQFLVEEMIKKIIIWEIGGQEKFFPK
jgi:uncharacterized membrane protein required for colicin V production